MAPDKSKKGDKVPTAAETKEDACFDKSPFSSIPMVKLQFKQGDPLSIHRALLQRNPKLALLDTSEQDRRLSTRLPPSLNHISRSAGHVLVHYLYTDSYQTLDWTGSTTGRDETIAKLRTGFEVYATARRFGLDRLEELAKEQISHLSEEIDVFTIVDVVSTAYPTSTGNDNWFPTYMKAVIKTAFKGSETLLKSEPSENEREDDIPTAKTLLRGAVEAYREMVETLAVKDVPVAAVKPVQVPERSQLEDPNTWGLETAKGTKNTKYAVELAPDPEPEPEPALMSEAISQPEDNDEWSYGTGKKSKKGKKCTSEPEPEFASIRGPTPGPAEDDNAIPSNNTGAWRPFGVISTTSNPFGMTNNATVGGPPGTDSPAFSPTIEKETPRSFQPSRFENILFMEAYKGWSSEELRLADYSQGHKQGSVGGGTGAFGALPSGKTGSASNK